MKKVLDIHLKKCYNNNVNKNNILKKERGKCIMEKITNKEMFNEVIELAKSNGRQDIVEWANGRIAQLDKKTANRKPAAEKKENIELANAIVDVLGGATEKMSTTEIGSAVGISTSKATSLLKGLVSTGKVTREVVKGKPMFELA